jgi:hypothetical protein
MAMTSVGKVTEIRNGWKPGLVILRKPGESRTCDHCGETRRQRGCQYGFRDERPQWRREIWTDGEFCHSSCWELAVKARTGQWPY